MSPAMDRINELAQLLGVDPDSFTIAQGGVVLTPDQIDLLWTTLVNKGFLGAIQALQDAALKAGETGPGQDLDQWAIYHSCASFLEGLGCQHP